jgi:chromosome segregation ATPase
MSMHTTQEWHHYAGTNMMQAQMAHKKASKQMDQSKKAHEVTVSSNLHMYEQLHQSLEQKVKNSYHLIDKLNRRVNSVDKSIEESKASQAQLEAGLRAKEAPLQLNMWRMEQRERRPLREQVRDAVELALESEKSVIVDTQRKLKDSIKRTRTMIVELQDKLEEVRHDIDQKTQALSVDEMCLRTTQKSLKTVADRAASNRPNSARLLGTTSAHQAAAHESTRNEANRQKEAERMNQISQKLEQQARALREANRELTAMCQRAQENAAASSERAMQDRVNENKQMRKRLEGEIKETHAKIEHTKNTISLTRYQLNALEEPMELTSTCASWRKQRATREHITDPVSTKLQEHQMTVLRAHQGLMEHHQSEKFNLKDLVERNHRLKEDLRDKTTALHIDLNCLTHEIVHASGKPTKYYSKDPRKDRYVQRPASVPAVPQTVR